MIAAAAASAIAAMLGVLMYRRLRGAHFPAAVSCAIVALAVLQMATALTASALAALVLAAALYLILQSAFAFADRQTARNVILLGGSLALVQTANPLGSLVAATLLPMIVVTQPEQSPRVQNGPLLVLLLFIPVSSAALIAYVARTSHVHFPLVLALAPGGMLPLPRGFLPRDARAAGTVHAACAAAIALPVWLAAIQSRTRRSIMVAMIGCAVAAALLATGFLGRDRPIGLIAPALAVLSVASVCEWPAVSGKQTSMFLLFGAAATVAWLCALLL